MTPALTLDSFISTYPSAFQKDPVIKPTSILHRTPWQPPVAIRAEGIYVELEDGRKLIDSVGGAAVACIGNGHPKVVQAIKDQLDQVSCMCAFHPYVVFNVT